MTRTATRGEARLVLFSRCASAIVLIEALWVLAAYARGDVGAIGLGLAHAAPSPVTALALACLAVATLVRAARSDPRVPAAIAGLLGVVAIAVLASSGRDPLSAALAIRLFDMPSGYGSTSLSTAVCIVLLAAGLLVAGRPASRRRVIVGDLCDGAALIASGLGVLAYAYRATTLFDIVPYQAMSLPTAVGLFLLALAMPASAPERGWAATVAAPSIGGAATRRQLLFTLLPPLVGFALVATTSAGLIDPGSAIALLVAATIAPLALLVLRDGAVLDLLDGERRTRARLQERMNEQLTAKLDAQAVELERRAAERLQAEAALGRAQRMDALGELTGGIAHDFNNLLTAIKGNIGMMERRLAPEHPASRYLDHALGAVDRATKVTQQLLAFSRTQRLDVRPTDLRAAVASAVSLIRQAMGPGIDVRFDAPAGDAWATADFAQLELALLNLAINGRDAMDGRGVVTLRLAIARDADATDAERGADFVVVSVEDTGRGMAPDVVARATEPFFTTKGRGVGTGIGLAQAEQFARQCGGALRIRSAVGEGTTVELWLPRVPAEISVAASAPASDVAPGRTAAHRRILVIDDDDAVRSTIVELLRDAGHTVVDAPDGARGLQQLAAFGPDIAVIDFIMPNMNGAEVARAARALRPSLPIVFVSGYSDTLALDGIENSMLVRKPFEFDVLMRAVEERRLH